MKVVINRCWGGFGLSRSALHELRKLGNQCALEETDIGERWDKDKPLVREKYLDSFCSGINRSDPQLVEVVEKLGEEASAPLARLVIVEIPDGIDYEIDDYDGMESVEEAHRSWS